MQTCKIHTSFFKKIRMNKVTQMMKLNLRMIASMVVLMFLFAACSTVKPWQKMYINDAEMELSAKKIEQFEINYETYREGASGANGGKVGGGCGCN